MNVSLADVEAELHATEAYLSAAAANTTRNEQSHVDLSRARNLLRREFSGTATARPRPPIPEQRRREILAKLSADRQAAVRNASPLRSGLSAHGSPLSLGRQQKQARPQVETSSTDIEPSFLDASNYEQFTLNQTQYYDVLTKDRTSVATDDNDEEDAYNYDDDDDEGEVFYASDIIGKPLNADLHPRSTIELFDQVEDGEDNIEGDFGDDSDVDELDKTAPTNYRPHTQPAPLQRPPQTTSYQAQRDGTIFSKVFLNRETHADHTSLATQNPDEGICDRDEPVDESYKGDRESGEPLDEPYERYDEDVPKEDHEERRNLHEQARLGSTSFIPPTRTAGLSRIDRLAAPRTNVFAEREKQRLVREMEALRECTFRPTVLQERTKNEPARVKEERRSPTSVKPKRVRFDIPPRRNSLGAFPWLSLSPRNHEGHPGNRNKQLSRQSLINRLHIDVSKRYEKRELQREQLEAERLRVCTFQPRINPRSRQLLKHEDHKPIHERISELQREKFEALQRAREELAAEQGVYSFTPAINPRSREIADTVLSEKQLHKARIRWQAGNDAEDVKDMLRPPRVTQRLVEDAEQLAAKRVAVQEYYDVLEEKPFAPKISEASAKLVQQKPEFKLDFLSRQEYFQMVEQERLEALEDLVQYEQEVTFRPDIGNAERVLREMRPDLMNESTQQRLQRLVYQEPKRTELKRERLREDTYGQFSFKPRINPISKALAERTRSATQQAKQERRHELQQYFAGKRFRSRVAKELVQAEKAECTFQPQLIARPKPKASSASKLDSSQRRSIWRSDTILHTIEAQRIQREEDLDAVRNALELRELENCTFQPNVHGPRASTRVKDEYVLPKKPVVVRGLSRFLELKERARRQQHELKQREDKVFNPNHGYEPRSYTIPKPFKLSATSKDAIRRRLKAKEELQARERVECTFTPNTGEAQRRQILKTLLKDP